MWYLSRTFEIEMGHALGKGYEGKCRNIHGHSWKVELQVKGGILDDFQFLVDFGILKGVSREICDQYDHTLVLNIGRRGLLSEGAQGDSRIQITIENPTSENFAKTFYAILKEWLERKDLYPRVQPDSVTIWETSNSKCIYAEDE